jgi:tetratricopeptide (TPR) repeat protein
VIQIMAPEAQASEVISEAEVRTWTAARLSRWELHDEQGEHAMKAQKWIFALALLALVAVPVVAQEAAAETSTQASAQQQASKDDIDEQWLNTIWTQVDDMVKTEEHKLQETVTVAGVRGAEAEDSILDKLYYRGAKRYPSQDKLTKAIETLTKAVAEAPKSTNAPMQKYFIAQCYEKLGRDTEARDYYGRVSKDHPRSSWATKAQKDLARMASR